MKQSVTIARALKEKNRIGGKLNATRKLIANQNSMSVKVPRNIDVMQVLQDAKMYEDRLIAIKTAIAVANKDIIEKIITLDEVKSEIAFYADLPTKEGVFERESYDRTSETTYEAVIKGSDVITAIEALKKKADNLQDDLDTFNALTKIEIELDD